MRSRAFGRDVARRSAIGGHFTRCSGAQLTRLGAGIEIVLQKLRTFGYPGASDVGCARSLPHVQIRISNRESISNRNHYSVGSE